MMEGSGSVETMTDPEGPETYGSTARDVTYVLLGTMVKANGKIL
jgi:hypothetical protein